MPVNEIVLNALQKGELNAISRESLMILTGLKQRDLHRCIEDLRFHGAVICSSSKGYFYPADEWELRKYIHRERSRADSIIANTRAAVDALSDWGGDSV